MARFPFADGIQLTSGLEQVVFVDLMRVGKEVVVSVRPTGVVALAGFVGAANLRAGLVNAASVVCTQVLTPGLELDVPIALFDEYADPLVHQIPTNVVVVPGGGRLVQGQGDVPAASG